MDAASLLQSHQSQARPSGCWTLAAGQATTLRPRMPGLLRIAAGSAWITFDGPHAGPGNDRGDLVLETGATVAVTAGRRLVIESRDAQTPVAFDWDFVPERQAVPARTAVALAWRDLGWALGLGAAAVGRLVLGLGAWGLGALLPRGPGRRAAA